MIVAYQVKELTEEISEFRAGIKPRTSSSQVPLPLQELPASLVA